MKFLKSKKAINFLFFQTGWFACALGASYGSNWLGPVVVCVAVGLQLGWFKQPLRALGFFILVGLIGTVFDSIPLSLGYFNFSLENPLPWEYPMWMSALWVNFASCFFISLSWLEKRLVLASIFGLIGGPLSYLSGESLGAINILGNRLESLVVIGLFWAVITPLLLVLKTKSQINNVE